MFIMPDRRSLLISVSAIAGLTVSGLWAQVPCKTGCMQVTSGCVSNSEFREFDKNVASSNFHDPNANPMAQADVSDVVTRTQWLMCDSCICTYSNCTYACSGAKLGGRSDTSQVIVSTVCVTTTP